MAPRIGQLLSQKGVITEQDLAAAERIQRIGDAALGLSPGDKIGKIIIRMGRASATDVIRALCEQNRVDDYMLVGNYVVSPGLVAQIPLEIAKRFSILPLVRCSSDGKEVFLGSDRPRTADKSREIEELLGLKIEWVELTEKHLARVIERVYALMAERGVRSVRIGEVLVREGLVTHDEIEWALKIARKTNTRIGRVLVREGLVSERKFYEVLSRFKRVPFATASEILSDPKAPEVAARLARTYAIFNEIIPFRLENSRLSVAVGDPETDLAELRKIYGCKEITLHLVTLSDMVKLLRALYALADDEAESKGIEVRNGAADDIELLPDANGQAPETTLTREELARLRQQYELVFTNLLLEAIRRRASDVHIENYETSVLVRLRIDGLLYDARTLRVDRDNVIGMVNVIKILSGMNIAERRVPQGGRFKKRTSSGDVYDFRVQVQPTLFGENVVIRLLHQAVSFSPLTDLGFSPLHLEKYRKIIRNPSGLVLITGPTGSGKTTTLYSTLDFLRKDTTKKIVTIEDPIEYSLPRIQQSQTLDIIGYTFAQATRAFLRQDPDIALVGEIRDEETAREAVKLCQTGHLVFSTLHTNTAPSAVPRLFVLGVDPELVASELLIVIAQRLARRICPDCKTAYEPQEMILRDFYPCGVPAGTVFHRGAGCARCDGLGHVGRVALAEFWFVGHDDRLLISRRADEDAIVDETIGVSFFPILLDALDKVRHGVIDISDLPTVLPMASLVRTARLIHDKGLAPSPRKSAA